VSAIGSCALLFAPFLAFPSLPSLAWKLRPGSRHVSAFRTSRIALAPESYGTYDGTGFYLFGYPAIAPLSGVPSEYAALSALSAYVRDILALAILPSFYPR